MLIMSWDQDLLMAEEEKARVMTLQPQIRTPSSASPLSTKKAPHEGFLFKGEKKAACHVE